MPKKIKIETPKVGIPKQMISQAVRYGDILFVSGQVGEDAQGTIAQGIEAQVDQALRNVQAVLEQAGATLDNVLMSRCFLKNQSDFAAFNQVYERWFGGSEIGPARYTVVAPMVDDAYLFEIAVFAGL